MPPVINPSAAPNKLRIVAGVCLMLGGALCLSGTYAASRGVPDDEPPDLIEFDESLVEKWKELQVEPPEFPREDRLLEFPVDAPATPFRYLIDEKSVRLDEDRVIRYSIVISARSGARNVMYEGIRCATQEYKTYAYGDPDNRFVPAQKPMWRAIRRDGSQSYRYELFRDYFCNQKTGLSYKVPAIISNLKYRTGGQFPGD